MKKLSLLKVIIKLIQKLIPVKRNRVVFTSFGGHYSDSPKYLSQKLHEMRPELELVWLVKEKYMRNLPEYVKAVCIDNFWKVFWYEATAHIEIDNVYGRKIAVLKRGKMEKILYDTKNFLNNKRSQKIFTTWHGTPLKRIGRDQPNHEIIDFSCPQTTMILGNQYNIDIMENITFGKLPTKLLGTPRNDILFTAKGNENKLKAKLGLPQDKKIILFAPTFRSDDSDGLGKKNIYRSGINQLREIDFERLFATLSKIFGGEWAMICRFHYHVEEMVDWQSLQKKYPDSIINGNEHDDMAEYLACADILLTDVSSSMFDFALTGKPCFLFFPDIEYYENAERGFYMPIREMPFKVAENFSDLLCCISEFDYEVYAYETKALLEKMGYVDDAESSKRAAEYILEKSFA